MVQKNKPFHLKHSRVNGIMGYKVATDFAKMCII